MRCVRSAKRDPKSCISRGTLSKTLRVIVFIAQCLLFTICPDSFSVGAVGKNGIFFLPTTSVLLSFRKLEQDAIEGILMYAGNLIKKASRPFLLSTGPSLEQTNVIVVTLQRAS